MSHGCFGTSNDNGWGGIRTHGTVTGTPVFETGAFNHSATHPASRETYPVGPINFN